MTFPTLHEIWYHISAVESDENKKSINVELLAVLLALDFYVMNFQ